MKRPWVTREVGLVLGLEAGRLYRAISNGEIPAPARGAGGAFAWSQEDIRRAGLVLCGEDPFLLHLAEAAT